LDPAVERIAGSEREPDVEAPVIEMLRELVHVPAGAAVQAGDHVEDADAAVPHQDSSASRYTSATRRAVVSQEKSRERSRPRRDSSSCQPVSSSRRSSSLRIALTSSGST